MLLTVQICLEEIMRRAAKFDLCPRGSALEAEGKAQVHALLLQKSVHLISHLPSQAGQPYRHCRTLSAMQSVLSNC